MNQAANFAEILKLRFGKNFRHTAITEKDMINVAGNPKPAVWDSHGEIEVVKFDDGSTYEPAEVEFCKPANAINATLANLANSVHTHDYFNGKTSLKQIQHILEVALTSKIGLIALDQPVKIVLGNGFTLNCVSVKS